MSEMAPEAAVEEPPPLDFNEPPYPDVEATVWRLGQGGMIISSVAERHAAELAGREREAIYFYADLGTSNEVKHDEETMQKVFKALAGQGLSEAQIINAVNAMQNNGVLFRESAV